MNIQSYILVLQLISNTQANTDKDDLPYSPLPPSARSADEHSGL